ncbi:MAG: thioredoxin [Planctomycetota bacterium]|nr:thioredoxin [Planctomycetota bacterium]MDA1212693.1 thioredoxin [Planctomycetota bacterium]
MSTIQQISQAEFSREVLQSSVPVLIDFYADWCGPCRMLSPTLQKIANDYGGKAKIVKVDVDQEPALAGKFNVSSIPTLVFMQNGEIVGKTSGLVSEAVLTRALDQMTA